MDWEHPLHFEWQANTRVSGEAVRGGGNEELPLSFLAPFSRVSFRVPLSRVLSQYPLDGELPRRLLRFSLLWERGCIVILMAQSIPSVPIPPKVFVECWHLLCLALDIWARGEKIAETLVYSQIRQLQSLLIYLSPIIGRNRSFVNKKTFF